MLRAAIVLVCAVGGAALLLGTLLYADKRLPHRGHYLVLTKRQTRQIGIPLGVGLALMVTATLLWTLR